MSLPIEGPMPLEKKRHEVTLFFADCKKKVYVWGSSFRTRKWYQKWSHHHLQ
jgi:hypothetical protein